MRTFQRQRAASAGQAYAALRHGGAPAERARLELALSPSNGRVLETLFRLAPAGRGPEAMRPRFARHEAHVAAVLGGGGFPALKL